jgi:hypothetical protein
VEKSSSSLPNVVLRAPVSSSVKVSYLDSQRRGVAGGVVKYWSVSVFEVM